MIMIFLQCVTQWIIWMDYPFFHSWDKPCLIPLSVWIKFGCESQGLSSVLNKCIFLSLKKKKKASLDVGSAMSGLQTPSILYITSCPGTSDSSSSRHVCILTSEKEERGRGMQSFLFKKTSWKLHTTTFITLAKISSHGGT